MGKLSTSLDDLEDMWFQIQRSAEGLLCDEPGNLRFHRVVNRDDDRFRSYRLTSPGKSPHLNSMPLVAWDVLRSTFAPLVERTGTYFRRAATASLNHRLFRIGEPLIDALAEYVRWDDRGQTFAFWRPASRDPDEVPYFRFDYVIDAETDEAQSLVAAGGSGLDPSAVQRRADGFFPPRMETIWTTVEGTEVLAPELTRLLEPPYDPARGDVNLNTDRRWALDQLIGELDWELRCRTVRERSEVALRNRDTFGVVAETAASTFEHAARLSETQREVRAAFVNAHVRAREQAQLSSDQRIDVALAQGMRSPRVRLHAIGVIVLAPGIPVGPGFSKAKN